VLFKWISVRFLLWILLSSIPHFLIQLFGFMVVSFLSSLYILNITPISDVVLVKIASQSVGCSWLCALPYRSFPISWGPIFQLLILEPEPLEFCLGLFSPMPISLRLFSTFSSIRFSVSDFMLRSLVHFGLELYTRWQIRVYFLFSTYSQPVRWATFIEDAFIFSIVCLAFLSKIKCVVLFLGLQFYSIDQHVCLYQYHSVSLTIAL
jgi:hypothetical protein